MALQTHKKIDDTGNDENDEGEDYDDEPVFKFSKVTLSSSVSRKANDDNKNTPDYLSCIAVHERFLVIGKNTGDILITDHLGTIIPQFQIQAVRKLPRFTIADRSSLVFLAYISRQCNID